MPCEANEREAFEAFLAEMEDDLDETIMVLEGTELIEEEVLNFKPRSFDKLERVVLELLANPERSPLTEEGLTDFVARYFGETCVRTLPACRWELCEDEASPALGLPVVRTGEAQMVAPHLVAEWLMDYRRVGTLRKAVRDLTRADDKD